MKNSQRQQQGHDSAEWRTDVGKKAENAGDDAPKQSSGHADEMKNYANENSIAGIHDKLKESNIC